MKDTNKYIKNYKPGRDNDDVYLIIDKKIGDLIDDAEVKIKGNDSDNDMCWENVRDMLVRARMKFTAARNDGTNDNADISKLNETFEGGFYRKVKTAILSDNSLAVTNAIDKYELMPETNNLYIEEQLTEATRREATAVELFTRSYENARKQEYSIADKVARCMSTGNDAEAALLTDQLNAASNDVVNMENQRVCSMRILKRLESISTLYNSIVAHADKLLTKDATRILDGLNLTSSNVDVKKIDRAITDLNSILTKINKNATPIQAVSRESINTTLNENAKKALEAALARRKTADNINVPIMNVGTIGNANVTPISVSGDKDDD